MDVLAADSRFAKVILADLARRMDASAPPKLRRPPAGIWQLGWLEPAAAAIRARRVVRRRPRQQPTSG